MKHSTCSDQSSRFESYADSVTNTSNPIVSAARFPTTRWVPYAHTLSGSTSARCDGNLSFAMSRIADHDSNVTRTSRNRHRLGDLSRSSTIQLFRVRITNHLERQPIHVAGDCRTTTINFDLSTGHRIVATSPRRGGPAVKPASQYPTWRNQGVGKDSMDRPGGHFDPRHQSIESARGMSPRAWPMKSCSIFSRIDVVQKHVCGPVAARDSRHRINLINSPVQGQETRRHFALDQRSISVLLHSS